MALNYLELYSILHNLSNKTKITQFGIWTREIHIREVGTKTKKQQHEQQQQTSSTILQFKPRKWHHMELFLVCMDS